MRRSRSSATGQPLERAHVRCRLPRHRLSPRSGPVRVAGRLGYSTAWRPQRGPRSGPHIRRGTAAVLACTGGGLDVRDRATTDRGVGDRERRLGSRRRDLPRFALVALLRAVAVALGGKRTSAAAKSSSSGRVTFPNAGPADGPAAGFAPRGALLLIL